MEYKTWASQLAYFYLLAEHQSSPDKFMPFRLLKYIVGAMDGHLKKYKVLPVVYPLVLYHGKKPYCYSQDLFDLFGEQKILAKTVMLQPFQLIDLSKISDSEIESHYWSGVMEMMMKHIKTRELVKKLQIIFTRLQALNDQDYVSPVLTYLYNASKITMQEAIKTLDQSNTLAGGKMKTLAEQFIEEGERRGTRKGERQGIELGKHQVARRLYELGLPNELIKQATGYSID